MNEFSRFAPYYDELYVKPAQYEIEATNAMDRIEVYKQSGGNDLLDIACGTGGHVPCWQKRYRVTGLDISPEMLERARQKYPGVEFVQGDMIDFDINREFDALVCLYGSIGFTRTVKNLSKALTTFARHMKPGGVLYLTPWSTKEDFKKQIVAGSVKHPDISIARMENVRLKNPDTIEVDFHHLIGRNGKVTYRTQTIRVGLFSKQQYQNAIGGAGLELMEYYQNADAPMGVFIARKPIT